MHFVFADIDVQLIFLILFLVMGFVSWISNFLKGAKRGGGAQRPGPRVAGAGDDNLRNEIEGFLAEVTGQKRREPQPDDDVLIEVVSEADERPRRKLRRPSGRRQQRPRDQPVRQRAKPAKAKLGSDLKRHVANYMAKDRIDGHVDEHLSHEVDDSSHEVDDSVRQHLGRAAESAYSRDQGLRQAQAHPIIAMLRDPQGVRNAILLHEILTRPRSLKSQAEAVSGK